MQKRSHSLTETCLNVASGFVISSLAWHFVVQPVWNIPTTVAENFQITGFFTVLSIARGYVWRRLGNWWTLRSLEDREPTLDSVITKLKRAYAERG